MKNLSSFLLFAWLGFQFVLALGIVFLIVVLSEHAPALNILFSRSEINGLNIKVLQTIDSMGILLNGIIVVCISLIFSRLQKAGPNEPLPHSVVLSLVVIQTLGFLSDIPFEHKNLQYNLISTVILGTGLLLDHISRKK